MNCAGETPWSPSSLRSSISSSTSSGTATVSSARMSCWPRSGVAGLFRNSALFNRINAVRSALGDTGEKQRLIRTLPRKGLRFVGDVREDDARTARGAQAGPPAAPSLTLPDRPSIAVLPFANMSDDPDQDHFADGLTEDLITALAHIRWLFVIARNSTFVYKGRAVNVSQVSRELGVRYVMEGSVRRSGNRLRISAQLIDALTGAHHWAERYDRQLSDIFAVQDEITRSVAGAIEPHLLAAEGVRTLSSSADDLGAWELVARAQTHFWRLTREDCAAAVEPLKRAVETHPDYAPARGLLAFCEAFSAHMGWIDREQGMLPGRSRPSARSHSTIAIPGVTSRSPIGP